MSGGDTIINRVCIVLARSTLLAHIHAFRRRVRQEHVMIFIHVYIFIVRVILHRNDQPVVLFRFHSSILKPDFYLTFRKT